MATKTNNLKLSKAENSDAILSTLESNNKNFDKLDEVIMRLRRNQLSGEASGTEIELTDAGEVESVLQLSGNSEQNNRNGKNRLKVTAISQTKNGVTMTVNEDKSITLNGTNTGTSSIFVRIGNDITLPAGTYTLSNRNSKVSESSFIFYDDGRNFAATNVATKTFDSEKVFKPYVKISAGATVNNETIYPMLIEGSYTLETLPPYEPYGLQPSPDYPSEIRSVKSKSDNLLNLTGISNTSVGSISGNEITLTWSSGFDCFLLHNSSQTLAGLESNQSYTVSFKHKGNAIRLYDYATSVGATTQNDSNYKEYSFTVKNITELKLDAIRVDTSGTAYIKDIQVNKGTEALPYQTYGYVPVEAKVEGKNLAQAVYVQSSTTVIDGVCTQTHTDTKANLEWKIVGKLNNEGSIQLAFKTYNDLGVKTLSFVKNSTFNQIVFGLNGSVKDNLVYIKTDDLIDGETYTLQWNILNNIQGSVSWNNIQIEKGSIATPYEMYKSKIISLPLGDIEIRSTPDGIRDTFKRVDGIWNKVINIGLFYCDPTLGWSNQSGAYDTEMRMMFSLSAGNHGVDRKFNTRSLCNRFTETIYLNSKPTVQNASVDVTAFNFHHQSGYENFIYFKLEKNLLDTQDAAGFQKWLSENPTEVTYVLATPTYTPITDQGLISALDELEELILHKGYNYITVTAVNRVKAYLDLTYYKDINLVLNNLAAQIASIGGAS